MNGSYNWTYYAEEINKENFQIFTDCNILVGQFNEEFNSLKKNLNKVDKIIPISIDYMDLYDLQNAKSYLARDFLIFANYASSKKKFDEALVILEKSRNFSSGKVSFIKATENIEKHIRLTKANIEKEIVNENIDSEIQQKSNQADNLKAEEIKRLLLEGKIAFYSQRYEKALEVYKKGLELLPGNYGCLMGLSRVSWKTKDFDQLCKYATLAANSSSGKKSAAALNFLALVYLDVKVDKSKALHYLDKCIELAPGNHVYYWNKRNV